MIMVNIVNNYGFDGWATTNSTRGQPRGDCPYINIFNPESMVAHIVFLSQ